MSSHQSTTKGPHYALMSSPTSSSVLMLLIALFLFSSTTTPVDAFPFSLTKPAATPPPPQPSTTFDLAGYMDRMSKSGDIELVNGPSLDHVLTPSEYAQLSLQLTPLCLSNPQLYNDDVDAGDNGDGEDNNGELAKLSSQQRQNVFQSLFPNTVKYVITDADFVFDGDESTASTTTTLNAQAIEQPQQLECEDDSMEIVDVIVDEAGNVIPADQSRQKHHQQPIEPLQPTSTTTNDDTNTNSKKPKYYYEFEFTTTELEADLPKFDAQFEAFIQTHEKRQLQQFQQKQQRQQREQAYKAQFDKLLSLRGFQPPASQKQPQPAAAAAAQPTITKLKMKRFIQSAPEQMAIKFDHFDTLLRDVCVNDKFRTVDEKLNVITANNVAQQLSLLTGQQKELDLIIQQDEANVRQRKKNKDAVVPPQAQSEQPSQEAPKQRCPNNQNIKSKQQQRRQYNRQQQQQQPIPFNNLLSQFSTQMNSFQQQHNNIINTISQQFQSPFFQRQQRQPRSLFSSPFHFW